MGEPITPGEAAGHSDTTQSAAERLAGECRRRIGVWLHRNGSVVHLQRNGRGPVCCFGRDSVPDDTGSEWVATAAQSDLWRELEGEEDDDDTCTEPATSG